MQCPEHQSEKSDKSLAPCPVIAPRVGIPPWDNVSQLTLPSAAAPSSVASPIKPNNLGIPASPELRVLRPINESAIDDGYDSDGLRAPWEDTEAVELDGPDQEEDPLPFGSAPLAGVEGPSDFFAEKIPTLDELRKMKVSALKEKLRNRGVSSKGKKEEMVVRLRHCFINNIPELENMSAEKAANMAGDCFSPGAFWEPLVCDGDFIEETQLEGFRAPTVPDGEIPLVKKRNYRQKIDRMEFSGQSETPVKWRNGRLAKTKKGEVKYSKTATTETGVNMDWIRRNKLSLDSHPVHWFEAFVPTKDKSQRKVFSIEKMTSWTNMRAMLDNASLGGKYPDFKNFTVSELMQHIGLYLFQGLSPSPQVEMKFKSATQDPVNGSDFIHHAFGGNSSAALRRHRHFKSFFTSNDPRYPTPPRDTHPNWKIHPFLKHITTVSQVAVRLGRNLSCDEQTIGFQGNHRDKQRITYKKEGDGFLADALCSDGYTYAFHFRHQPASQKLMHSFNCSPLHARVLGLLSQLPDKYYTLGMDNLYMSAKLCRLAYGMKQKVMVHGVTRATLRGIPAGIKQVEVTKKAELAKVRHTVTAAILKGDEVCNDLISLCVYDTKPVYFLSNVCEGIEWIKKERKVYDPIRKQQTVMMPFYRLNVIDFYNNNMGNVDLADQLRNTYRYDTTWHRNRKWWWSIWWWGFQLLLTNAYILYRKYHLSHNSKVPVTHYEFIKQITLAWIDPDTHWPKGTEAHQSKKRKAAEQNEDQDTVVTRATRKLNLDYQTSPSLSSDSNPASATSSICIPVTEKNLHPLTGKLKHRLNYSVQHYPQYPKVKAPRCQLHRWARGRDQPQVKKSVVMCSVCRVNLCIPCFNLFHKEANLTDIKSDIAEN